MAGRSFDARICTCLCPDRLTAIYFDANLGGYMHILHHAKNAFIRQVLGGGADSVRVRARFGGIPEIATASVDPAVAIGVV